MARAARAALAISRAEPWRRERVLALGRGLASDLAAAGYTVAPTAGSIVAVVLGTPERALDLAATLRDRGLSVPAIRPPTVPAGTARLRISLSAVHRDEEVARLVEALRIVAPTAPKGATAAGWDGSEPDRSLR
jgi:8-amino-7-oxononanoate synthase